MAAETVKAKLPLVVIAGPTASGKTSLAIRLGAFTISCWRHGSLYRCSNF